MVVAGVERLAGGTTYGRAGPALGAQLGDEELNPPATIRTSPHHAGLASLKAHGNAFSVVAFPPSAQPGRNRCLAPWK